MKINKYLGLITIAIVITAALSLQSCKKDGYPTIKSEISDKQAIKDNSIMEMITLRNSSNGESYCGEIKSVDLKAGQHINAGKLDIYNDENNLYVKYSTVGNWKIGKTHLYVGLRSGIPVNAKGNPMIGNFPYKTVHNPWVTEFEYTIPLINLPECFIVAAHAEVFKLDELGNVIQAETAWGNGTRIVNQGNWAMYIDYCKQACNPCIINPKDFDIFGGQTILVGTLSVVNDETNLYITYKASGDWYFNKTHLYIGTLDNLPVNNSNVPIPGQFPYSVTHNPLTQEYTYVVALSNLPPCYIIAAHGEVVKVIDGVTIQKETSWSYGTPFPNTSRWGWYSSYCTQTCE